MHHIECLYMRQKGIDLNNNFYLVVGKQCRTEKVYTISLYNLTYVLLLFFCFKLCLNFSHTKNISLENENEL